ncbi:hypothetical protein KUTeg_015323 [Tegillarca granosa]|uniref:Calcineurin-like phosphoesterase domain-containing protein n=1 Tax=Tegillarca granosa TaxID=220873 RepID=A0ABQ9EPV2_TEGGR|nr:hypothetical protein KUTeg_015323 [Tegillarca granosa]
MATNGNSEPVVILVEKNTVRPSKVWEILKMKQNKQKVERLNHKLVKISDDKLRFVCLSDTHSKIERLTDPNFVPPGDVLLHAGDFTKKGTIEEIKEFNDYLGTLPHKHKVVIAGNHDLTLDNEVVYRRPHTLRSFGIAPSDVDEYLKKKGLSSVKDLLTNCIYLEDSMVEICGIKIYGSPWQPEFHGWAFNVERGEEILKKWNKIPEGIDILMTHGPPVGYGDVTSGGNHVGCVELLNTVQKRVVPNYHIFGHIHEGYGMFTDGTTNFINASTCTLRYKPVNPPIVFDYPLPDGYNKENLLDVKLNS